MKTLAITVLLAFTLIGCSSSKITGYVTVMNKIELNQGGYKYYFKPNYGRSFVKFSTNDYEIGEKVKL